MYSMPTMPFFTVMSAAPPAPKEEEWGTGGDGAWGRGTDDQWFNAPSKWGDIDGREKIEPLRQKLVFEDPPKVVTPPPMFHSSAAVPPPTAVYSPPQTIYSPPMMMSSPALSSVPQMPMMMPSPGARYVLPPQMK
uniref:Uncharacterized protein n=1 Tax=Chromera velia CCMP2878 TaxID=1169474 RepID=A0A0G4HC77_9ALVE|eukprot:Cvel_6289.t1-p1 / transcript=Cvel_6289.t1 / gene=Cvel_6289 / organism=Chromera_velia_CCMP2878 / gene_product=hypothetical protein / transcript_product=hypothetical protein / location=Cvel_scaffold305:42366-42896(+) / protein_length=134 / sequence_SO=supercontig / SO=protein_coding / is_pseudo=false